MKTCEEHDDTVVVFEGETCSLCEAEDELGDARGERDKLSLQCEEMGEAIEILMQELRDKEKTNEPE